MPVITLTELRDKVRQPDWDNSPIYTDALVTRYINEALAELYDLVTNQFEGYFVTDTIVPTIAGEQAIELPDDFYTLHAIDRDIGDNRYTPLRRINFSETYQLYGTGKPVGYMLGAASVDAGSIGTVKLWPIPDGVYDIRIVYDPLPVTLAADGDDFDFRNGWEDYVIWAARLRMANDEERPIGEIMAMIDRATKRVIASAGKRDSAEPDYLSYHDTVLVEDLL